MTIAEEILDLKSRVSAAFSACEAKSATMPSIRTTHTLADTINTIPTGGQDSREDDIIMRTVSGTYENSNVSIIGNYGLAYCTNLTTVSFPNVTSISQYAFIGCNNLTTGLFPNATSIGSSAFQSCSGLTTTSFPQVTSIGAYAFSGCANLITGSFPNAISLYTGCFRSCNNLAEITLPYVSNISSGAFASCGKLKYVSFPFCMSISGGAAATGGGGAFASCTSLSYAYLPICEIGSNTFNGCSNLERIVLRGTISIPTSAFFKCTKLSAVYITGTLIGTLSSNVFNSTPLSTSSYLGYYGSIYVRDVLADAVKAKTGWSYYSDRIVGIPMTTNLRVKEVNQESSIITDIDFDITQYQSTLEEIEDLVDIKDMGNYTSSRMINTLFTSIPSSQFFSYYSLRSVSLQNCITINRDAFRHCENLTTVSLPNCVDLGIEAFADCYSLTDIYLPRVSKISGYTFLQCSSLTSISLPSCKRLDGQVFGKCSNLTTVSLPACYEMYGQTFSECRSLKSVYFRSPYMKSIDQYPFATTPSDMRIFVPTSLVSYYKNLSGWSRYTSQILPFDDWDD